MSCRRVVVCKKSLNLARALCLLWGGKVPSGCQGGSSTSKLLRYWFLPTSLPFPFGNDSSVLHKQLCCNLSNAHSQEGCLLLTYCRNLQEQQRMPFAGLSVAAAAPLVGSMFSITRGILLYGYRWLGCSNEGKVSCFSCACLWEHVVGPSCLLW